MQSAKMQLGAAPRSLAPTSRSRSVTCMSARVDKCNKRSVVVSPSILSANFAKLGEQARPSQRSCFPSELPAQPA